MNKIIISCTVACIALGALAANAQEVGRTRGPWSDWGPEFRQRILEKFDADQDGTLNPEERAKAREAVRARWERTVAGPEAKKQDGPQPRTPMARQGKGPHPRGLTRGPAGRGPASHARGPMGPKHGAAQQGAWPKGPRFHAPRAQQNQPGPGGIQNVMRLVSWIDINRDGDLDQREIRLAHARIDRIAQRMQHGPMPNVRGPESQRGKGPGPRHQAMGPQRGPNRGPDAWRAGPQRGKGKKPGMHAAGPQRDKDRKSDKQTAGSERGKDKKPGQRTAKSPRN